MVVAAEDDGAKLDPTRKVVVYGGVEAQDTGSYTLRWDQVRCSVPVVQARMARDFDPNLRARSECCGLLPCFVFPRHFISRPCLADTFSRVNRTCRMEIKHIRDLSLSAAAYNTTSPILHDLVSSCRPDGRRPRYRSRGLECILLEHSDRVSGDLSLRWKPLRRQLREEI